jgi:C_GCAxxG_C_C family probable redox protein
VTDFVSLRKRADELAAREWDVPSLEDKIRKLTAEGIPRKKLDPVEVIAEREEILDRVQLRSEEYNFILKNCAQGTALALMEEFGLGDMEVIHALTPFPGIAGTGEICGGIIGGLISFGLFFGGRDRLDYVTLNNNIRVSQKFMACFEEEIGNLYCSEIIETVILGHSCNPGQSEEAMMIFTGEKGFERCGLPVGIGVRLAAGFMIDSMNSNCIA